MIAFKQSYSLLAAGLNNSQTVFLFSDTQVSAYLKFYIKLNSRKYLKIFEAVFLAEFKHIRILLKF